VGVYGECHIPATLAPGITQYPSCRRLAGWQDWSGWVWKISPLLQLDPQTVHPILNFCTDHAVVCPGEHGNEPLEVHERLEISGVYE